MKGARPGAFFLGAHLGMVPASVQGLPRKPAQRRILNSGADAAAPLPKGRMDIFLQQIINGLTLGSVYALVALGYTMVYGIIGLINFAHGEVVMIGAMVSLSVVTALLGAHAPLPPVLIILAGLVVAVLVCMTLAYGMEKIAYRPLRKAPRLAPLITAIGMSIILQNLALMIWGRNYLTFPTLIEPTTHFIFGAAMTDLQMLIAALA